MLAGVSSSYYTRLEQGQSANASPQVLAALARALGLSQAERGHLEALGRAGLRRPSPDEPEPEVVAPAFLELLDTLGEAPAMVVGQRRDILAWNRTGHALFAGHVDAHAVHDPLARPNATALVFLDRHTRELYADWNDKAQASVGHLRILAAQQPNDARLLELIGRLIVQSLEFARMWATNQIRSTSSATYRMRHPLVGYLEVTQQLLTSARQSVRRSSCAPRRRDRPLPRRCGFLPSWCLLAAFVPRRLSGSRRPIAWGDTRAVSMVRNRCWTR